jgi:hypothetical protein
VFIGDCAIEFKNPLRRGREKVPSRRHEDETQGAILVQQRAGSMQKVSGDLLTLLRNAHPERLAATPRDVRALDDLKSRIQVNVSGASLALACCPIVADN